MGVKTLNKIQSCRASIKANDLSKGGRNDYSNYDYYTPEQVDRLVYDVCVIEKLFNKYELRRDENGIYGQITVFDLESDDKEVFIGATEMPVITAINATQQMGGCMTYTERYLLMFIYDIKDNNFDPDANDNRPKSKQPMQPTGNPDTQNPEDDKPWLNELDKDKNVTPEYVMVKDAIARGVRKPKDARKAYKVSTAMMEKLERIVVK